MALVEGSRLHAAGVAALLGTMAPEVTLTAVRQDLAEFRPAIARYRPDIAIFDMRTIRPEFAGLLRWLQVHDIPVRSLAIIRSPGPPGVGRLLTLGLGGLVSADIEPDDLLNVIRVLHAGRLVLDPTALAELLGGRDREVSALGPSAPGAAALAPSELELLRLAAAGMSNEEIAKRLAVSPSTLKRNLRLTIGKLAARDRTSAVVAAVRAGLI